RYQGPQKVKSGVMADSYPCAESGFGGTDQNPAGKKVSVYGGAKICRDLFIAVYSPEADKAINNIDL
ncbi:MAG: hypothetical protein Q7W05_07320, partial [Deltaproteobacteria bacterium]|nr:hypothetical protein [Deltaproteobacteria bacterium]